MQPQVEQVVIKLENLSPDRLAEVEDFIDFLQQREQAKAKQSATDSLDFPVDNVGPWPDEFSLSREDLYSDDGR